MKINKPDGFSSGYICGWDEIRLVTLSKRQWSRIVWCVHVVEALFLYYILLLVIGSKMNHGCLFVD